MRRKRSLKHRYFRLLKRFWPLPALASMTVFASSAG
jgi:hypothetical protein